MYLDGGKYSYDPTKSYLHADSRHKPWHINGASKKLQCHWGKLAWGIQDVRKTALALLISFWDIGVASKCKPAGGPPRAKLGPPRAQLSGRPGSLSRFGQLLPSAVMRRLRIKHGVCSCRLFGR